LKNLRAHRAPRKRAQTAHHKGARKAVQVGGGLVLDVESGVAGLTGVGEWGGPQGPGGYESGDGERKADLTDIDLESEGTFSRNGKKLRLPGGEVPR